MVDNIKPAVKQSDFPKNSAAVLHGYAHDLPCQNALHTACTLVHSAACGYVDNPACWLADLATNELILLDW